MEYFEWHREKAQMNKTKHNVSFDEAITEYLAGIKLKPDFAELYNDLGVSYLKKGQAEKASDAFKTALKLNPDFAEAVRNLEGINR